MIGFIVISAIGLTLLSAAKQSGAIGRIPTKARRNKYAEIAWLQQRGVQFYQDEPRKEDINALREAILRYGYKPPKSANYDNLIVYYFHELQRLYRRITKPIGYMEADESIIYNQNGDIALKHYQYDYAREWERAAGWFQDNFVDISDEVRNGYNLAVDAIARGQKFIWSGWSLEPKDKNKKRPTQMGIKEWLGYGDKERKTYINILASKDKGGVLVERLAADFAGYNGDDAEMRDGILEAIRDFNSADAAKQYILSLYNNAKEQEQNPWANYYDPNEYQAPF